MSSAIIGSATTRFVGPALGASSTDHQRTSLTRLLNKYAYDQAHGSDATVLASLGKQIMAAAKELGQHVSLPGVSATAEAAETSDHKVDLKA